MQSIEIENGTQRKGKEMRRYEKYGVLSQRTRSTIPTYPYIPDTYVHRGTFGTFQESQARVQVPKVLLYLTRLDGDEDRIGCNAQLRIVYISA